MNFISAYTDFKALIRLGREKYISYGVLTKKLIVIAPKRILRIFAAGGRRNVENRIKASQTAVSGGARN